MPDSRRSVAGAHPRPAARHALLASLLLAGCARAGTPAAALPRIDAPPGVRLTTRVVEYPVTATTLAELRREMLREGPVAQGVRYPGATHWRVRWSYRYERDGGRCALREVVATVDTRVELPRWAPGTAPDSAVVRWWEGFRTRLVDHEAGHVRLAAEAGGTIVERLRPLQGAACDALGEQANAIGRDLLQAARARQAAYDRDTRHGATPPPRAVGGPR